jgi:hypothetical protein
MSNFAKSLSQDFEEQNNIQELKERYLALSHAMQSGVAMMMNYDDKSTSPKHLRVGVNSALIESGALGGLLVTKGIITEKEYWTAIVDTLENEVAKYERLIQEITGAEKITLK